MVCTYNVCFSLTVSIFHWSRCCKKKKIKPGQKSFCLVFPVACTVGGDFLTRIYILMLLLKVAFLIAKAAINFLPFAPQDIRLSSSVAASNLYNVCHLQRCANLSSFPKGAHFSIVCFPLCTACDAVWPLWSPVALRVEQWHLCCLLQWLSSM